MSVFSSLTNRIFFGSALLAVVAIAVAVYRVNVVVTRQAENELRRGLEEAGTLLEEYRTTLFEHFSKEARLVADLSNLKAAITTGDPATVRPLALAYQRRIGCDLLIVTDPAGRVLAETGRLKMGTAPEVARDAIARAARGREAVALWPHPGGIIQVVSVPSVIDPELSGPELIGTLSVGFILDREAAERFKALTNSEIAFAVGNRIEASTLPHADDATLAWSVAQRGVQRVTLGDSEYAVLARPLPIPSSEDAVGGTAEATAILLRSRTERLRLLSALHRDLAGTALLALLAATVLSYGIARTVTRPLGAITATMREMANTGDLTRKIPLSPRSRWEDEDARLLASTFNTMTDSIERFQRDAAQRERLSSLGRLSTVVAHEIRNPLMIIKAALRPLRRQTASPDEVRAAAADIDEEVARLNRIVSEVLDFARPIRFDLAPADVNGLCADAARASSPDAGTPHIVLHLEPGIPLLTTDAERLRLVLVNVLTNARHAVTERDASMPGAIALTTRLAGPNRVSIEVRDRGAGIRPEDMPRIFDPFFTTRRAGTGLGLAISRNIIEGLGGTIAVASTPGEGTVVRIELPVASRGAASHAEHA